MLGSALLATVACSAFAADGWRMEEFMVSGWGAPTDEAAAKAFVEAGFNTVMGTVEHLELYRAHGLKAILRDATPEYAAEHQGDEAIWGYYVQDEPKAEEFAQAGERLAALQAADPTHPGYVNLMAWMDLNRYFSTVKPWFLSYDYYQWWWGSQHHFGRLAAHRQAALEAGVPLICWVEANADKRYEWGEPGAGYLPDNAAKLRQSVYTALAYGVRGIQWFTTGLVFRPGGALTESGFDVRAINTEVNGLGPTLLGLRSTGVRHTDPVPEGASGLSEDGRIAAASPGLVVGEFVEDATGGTFLLVVNRSTESNATAALTVRGIEARVSAFDVNPPRWYDAGLRDAAGQAEVTLALAPGGGALLRLE